MKNIKTKIITAALLAGILLMMIPAFPVHASGETASTTTSSQTPNFSNVTAPIESMIRAILRPALGIVGALGSLFCIILGVKFAKAEEPQEREKAKAHLKNAIIGFVLIFVLLVALNALLDPMITWVTSNAKGTGL